MITPLFWAKMAAVLSVIYGGANAYQLLSRYDDVREKSRIFSEMVAAAGGSTGRLRVVRAFFYIVPPLCYLWALRGAGIPGLFLVAAGVKFGVSSFLGIGTEKRLLRGGEYRPLDHVIARADATLNLALAALAVWLILRAWA
jgi:hypothetical protein